MNDHLFMDGEDASREGPLQPRTDMRGDSDADETAGGAARTSKAQPDNVLDLIDASNAEVLHKSAALPFEEVLKGRASRRAVLAGGLGLAAASFFESTSPASAFGLDFAHDQNCGTPSRSFRNL